MWKKNSQNEIAMPHVNAALVKLSPNFGKLLVFLVSKLTHMFDIIKNDLCWCFVSPDTPEFFHRILE